MAQKEALLDFPCEVASRTEFANEDDCQVVIGNGLVALFVKKNTDAYDQLTVGQKVSVEIRIRDDEGEDEPENVHSFDDLFEDE